MEQRAQRPNLFGLCRVATEEDKVKEEDELKLKLVWTMPSRAPMEQRAERPSLLRLSRVVTEEDKSHRGRRSRADPLLSRMCVFPIIEHPS